MFDRRLNAYVLIFSLLEGSVDGVCPMCSNTIKPGDLTKLPLDEVTLLLRTQYTE